MNYPNEAIKCIGNPLLRNPYVCFDSSIRPLILSHSSDFLQVCLWTALTNELFNVVNLDLFEDIHRATLLDEPPVVTSWLSVAMKTPLQE